MRNDSDIKFRKTDFSNEDLQPVAQVVKSNGADGELLMVFFGISPEDFDIGIPLFIYYDGLPVPFFIESFKVRGTSKAIVRLTGLSSYEDIEEISGQKVFVEKHNLEEDIDEDLSMLVGWTLSDGHSNWTITDFIDIPQNPCIEISTKKGAVMIPLHEDLILSLDPSSETIVMKIPDGLI